MNIPLQDELVATAEEDQRVRAELAADGSLFGGYHERVKAVHDENAARLVEIINRHGGPGRGLVGEDGARAVWLVLQHAIGHPTTDPQKIRGGDGVERAVVAQHFDERHPPARTVVMRPT